MRFVLLPPIILTGGRAALGFVTMAAAGAGGNDGVCDWPETTRGRDDWWIGAITEEARMNESVWDRVIHPELLHDFMPKEEMNDMQALSVVVKMMLQEMRECTAEVSLLDDLE
jgi:hypothetical protein